MQVYCTDGTVFRVRSYEVTQYGVQLYGQPLEEEDDRYADDPEQRGFVPHDQLRYILPDGVTAAAAPPGGQPPQRVRPTPPR